MKQLNNPIFDIIIIGAGPAGSCAALYASKMGLKVLLLDKSEFPRDKICGDAISGKSMLMLRELGLMDEALNLPGAHIHSIRFGSTTNKIVDISLQGSKRKGTPTGLVIPRKIFDAFLFGKARAVVTETLDNYQVKNILIEDEQVTGVRGINLNTNEISEFRAKIVLGADGLNSILAKELGIFNRLPKHRIVAVRQYYKNVSVQSNQIELHFVDELLPGYFWIFPAGDNLTNVGFGIKQDALTKTPIDFKKAIPKFVSSAAFSDRFKNSQTISDAQARILAVANTHRKNFGNGFLLLGDAAGLIDPFTGEGIGNAMVSGKHAAQTAWEAIENNRFDASMLAAYDKNLWAHIGPELRMSRMMQRLANHKFLLNMVINKASEDKEAQEIISGMMANTISRYRLVNPLFYLRLLFS